MCIRDSHSSDRRHRPRRGHQPVLREGQEVNEKKVMSVSPVADEAVRNVLLGVMDPELGDNIVDLGMVHVIEIDPRGGDVDVTIALTTAGCPLRAQIMKDIKLRVATLPGVAEVRVHFGEMTTEQKRNVMARARFKAVSYTHLRAH